MYLIGLQFVFMCVTGEGAVGGGGGGGSEADEKQDKPCPGKKYNSHNFTRQIY